MRLTPIQRQVYFGLLQASSAEQDPHKRQGCFVRYPDLRRSGRGYDTFHVARRTLESLERKGLVHASHRGGFIKGGVIIRWIAKPHPEFTPDRGDKCGK